MDRGGDGWGARWPSSCPRCVQGGNVRHGFTPTSTDRPVPPTPDLARSDHEASFAAARDGVAVLGPEWQIRYMNASMLEILRLLGGGEGVRTLWDALPGWERSDAAGSLRLSMESQRPVCFRVDGENGRGRVWEVEAEPLANGDLRVRVHNVTEQARVEEAERARAARETLAVREARLAAIVSAAPVGMVLMDADTLLVREANAFYSTFLEGPWRAPGAIVGHAPREFLPGFDQAVEPIFRSVQLTGKTAEVPEFEFHGFSRGVTWFRWILQKVDGGAGGPGYLLLLVVEITQQVLGRRAAEAERRALYDVVDTLPVGVIVANARSGEMEYMNAAAVALGGRPREELAAGVAEHPGRWSLFRPTGEPFPAAELPLARAIAGETVHDVEVVVRLPAGDERTVMVSGSPLRDAAGEVDRALVAFYDMSERLELERALLDRTRDAEAAASEAALRADESRALREIGRALVSELEPDRVLALAARSAMELLGTRGSVVATPLGDGRVRLGPSLGALADLDGTTVPLAGTVVERVLNEGVPVVLNDIREAPRSSPFRAGMLERGIRNLAEAPLRAFGTTLGLLAVADRATPFTDEDVRLLEGLADTAALAIHNARVYASERHRADENRALVASAEALASTLDAGEVMRRIARAAVELTGADGAAITTLRGERGERTEVVAAFGVLEPVLGANVPTESSVTRMTGIGPDPRTLATADLPATLPSRPLLLAAGADFLAVVPLRAGEEVVGILALANRAEHGEFGADAVRRVRLLAEQAALAVRNARLYQAAESASRAKSEFLAVMSHELRTPLNALEGYASLLEDEIYGPLTERQRQALARMKVSRRHLMELIESVLDLARVEAGTRRAEVEEVDLAELVGSVGEAMRGAAEARKLELVVDASAAGRVCTDRGLLRQVLTNLLGNAIKFTERGRVSVRARSGGGAHVMEVEDTGPGITADNQERIFEPFFQVDPSTTRKEGGTGLGLALSREFVALLGGELTVRSEPGRGSTFTVTLADARR